MRPKGKKNLEDSDDRDDDDFFHQMANIEQTLIVKVEKGEYVDLSKLLPWEKVLHNEGKMHLINKDGASVFVLITEKDAPAVNSFKQWEQAFGVFANIYCRVNPNHAAEMFQ